MTTGQPKPTIQGSEHENLRTCASPHGMHWFKPPIESNQQHEIQKARSNEEGWCCCWGLVACCSLTLVGELLFFVSAFPGFPIWFLFTSACPPRLFANAKDSRATNKHQPHGKEAHKNVTFTFPPRCLATCIEVRGAAFALLAGSTVPVGAVGAPCSHRSRAMMPHHWDMH